MANKEELKRPDQQYRLFDTHAHYTDDRFDGTDGEPGRDELLSCLPQWGVTGVVDCACTESDWEKVGALSDRYPFVWCALGFHGLNATETTQGWQDRLLRAIKATKKCVAIGEIGIDYHYEAETAALQQAVFADQLCMAAETGLPVIVHDREAHADVYAALHGFAGKITGVLHCYSGSAEMIIEHRKLDFYYGFGGSLTFKNNEKGVRAARACPEDRLLIETDCPYLAPVPYRGRRNDSRYVRLVCERLAEIRDTTPEHIAEITDKNARTLFNQIK